MHTAAPPRTNVLLCPRWIIPGISNDTTCKSFKRQIARYAENDTLCPPGVGGVVFWFSGFFDSVDELTPPNVTHYTTWEASRRTANPGSGLLLAKLCGSSFGTSGARNDDTVMAGVTDGGSDHEKGGRGEDEHREQGKQGKQGGDTAGQTASVDVDGDNNDDDAARISRYADILSGARSLTKGEHSGSANSEKAASKGGSKSSGKGGAPVQRNGKSQSGLANLEPLRRTAIKVVAGDLEMASRLPASLSGAALSGYLGGTRNKSSPPPLWIFFQSEMQLMQHKRRLEMLRLRRASADIPNTGVARRANVAGDDTDVEWLRASSGSVLDWMTRISGVRAQTAYQTVIEWFVSESRRQHSVEGKEAYLNLAMEYVYLMGANEDLQIRAHDSTLKRLISALPHAAPGDGRIAVCAELLREGTARLSAGLAAKVAAAEVARGMPVPSPVGSEKKEEEEKTEEEEEEEEECVGGREGERRDPEPWRSAYTSGLGVDLRGLQPYLASLRHPSPGSQSSPPRVVVHSGEYFAQVHAALARIRHDHNTKV